MVGSRYSNFRLKICAEPGADFIINALTFTRIEPHIAHLPLRRALPGQELEFQATVTLPAQILMPVKNSLSIARGTTSTIEPPDKLKASGFSIPTDDGRTYQCTGDGGAEDIDLFRPSFPQTSVQTRDDPLLSWRPPIPSARPSTCRQKRKMTTIYTFR